MEFYIETGWISLVFLAAFLAVVGVLIVKAVQRAGRQEAARQKTSRWLKEFSALKQKTSLGYDAEDRLSNLHRIQALGPIPAGFERHHKVGEAQVYLDGLASLITKEEEGIAATIKKRREDMATFTVLQEGWDSYSVRQRFTDLFALKYLSLDAFAASWVRAHKKQAIRDYCDSLLAGARSGNRDDFMTLFSLLMSNEYNDLIGWDIQSRVSGYMDASDWDDMVVTYLKNPSLSDFSFVKTDQPAGEVRLMAARAIRERSLKDAKIALAFCAVRYASGSGDYWPYRDEIGDVLMAELAKLVVELHIEQNLTFASTLSSDS